MTNVLTRAGSFSTRALSDPMTWYMVLYTASAFLGLFFPNFYGFQLLDLVIRSSLLKVRDDCPGAALDRARNTAAVFFVAVVVVVVVVVAVPVAAHHFTSTMCCIGACLVARVRVVLRKR